MIEYADAIREAREWVVDALYNGERGASITDADKYFVSWYGAGNHSDYTVSSAYKYFNDGNSTRLELREGQGSVPSTDLRRERDIHATDEQGRENPTAPGSRSIPEGVILWS